MFTLVKVNRLFPQPVKIGSSYGGWFVDTRFLNKPLNVVSVGAGEDISFDLMLASTFHVDNLLIVDPTPRAISHFQHLERLINHSKALPPQYNFPDECYEFLQNLFIQKKISFEKYAIWKYNGEIKFFPPKNNAHVSHSIVSLPHSQHFDDFTIIVPCITLDSLMTKNNISSIDILKLDIEGAEHEVLDMVFKSLIRPTQILVEYDELFYFRLSHIYRFYKTHFTFLKCGYKLIKRDLCNFTYILHESIQ